MKIIGPAHKISVQVSYRLGNAGRKQRQYTKSFTLHVDKKPNQYDINRLTNSIEENLRADMR